MAERGIFHATYPGILEVYAPLNSVRDIEKAENILKSIREIIMEQEGDIPKMTNLEWRESDLLSLESLGWS